MDAALNERLRKVVDRKALRPALDEPPLFFDVERFWLFTG
jgi:hypothetical protein